MAQRGATLPARIASSAVLVPLALAAVVAGVPWMGLLLVIIAFIMASEWAGVCFARDGSPARWGWRPPVVAVVLLVAVTTSAAIAAAGWLLPAILLAAAGTVVVWAVGRFISAVRRPRILAAGVLYICVPVAALLWLRSDPDFGMITLFWLLGVVWATDSGGYIFGKALGGPRLAPAWSPNKTWAGAVGGAGLAAAVGVGFAAAGGFRHTALVIGGSIVTSIVAQLGDLLESAAKRHFDVKDSGSIIPGHGGLFDRLDGLFAAAPLVALLFLLTGGALLWR